MIKLACCGDKCNQCPRYVGTKNNDVNALKKAAEIWYRVGWRDKILSPDEMKCYGCLSVRKCIYGIKECCEKKQIDNCGYCTEIPCRKLKEIFKSNEEHADRCKSLLSKEEYDMFKAAFWMKEKYLNKIRNEKND